jgi:hypothetical protein
MSEKGFKITLKLLKLLWWIKNASAILMAVTIKNLTTCSPVWA